MSQVREQDSVQLLPNLASALSTSALLTLPRHARIVGTFKVLLWLVLQLTFLALRSNEVRYMFSITSALVGFYNEDL